MNREIKFRGYDYREEKWYYGNLVLQDYDREFMLSDTRTIIANDKLRTHVVDNGTVGQYTGVKDKNGKEIYEGDIVRFVRNFSKYKCSKNYDFEVYFNDFLCHFALNILDDYSNSYGKNGQYDILTLTSAKVKDLEVIGNIYEV